MKENEGKTKNDLLKECGYCLNYDTLTRVYNEATHGKELKPGTVRWYEAVSPLLVLAYQAGADGLPLTECFPFLGAIN